MHYAIVLEKTKNNYSAHVPDLPGCVATGFTVEETEREIRGAIKFTSRDSLQMACPFHNQASLSILKLLPIGLQKWRCHDPS